MAQERHGIPAVGTPASVVTQGSYPERHGRVDPGDPKLCDVYWF
jgi:hypothetical protein